MLASLLTTLYNSTDITQSAQSLSANAFLQIDSSIGLTQANQSLLANAFIQINGNISVDQSGQSLDGSLFLQINGLVDVSQSNQLLNAQYQQAQKDEAQQREDTLKTLGAYSQDYQAQINKLQNDNDTTNDWQIPYLQMARQEKIDTQRKEYNPNQFYSDYQAEINRINNQAKSGDIS